MTKSLQTSRSPLALVSGASSGIGEAFARELAARGWNLFLHGRDAQALKKLTDDLQIKHPQLLVKTHLCDLSTESGVTSLLQSIEESASSVDVFVHNAGFTVHGQFSETPLKQESSLVNLQIQALLSVTKALLPEMIRNSSSDHPRGLINVASVYSYAPVPFQSVYGACKAFLLWFGEALRIELLQTGVHVLTVCPGVTQTRFRSRSGVKDKNPNAGLEAQTVARLSIDAFLARRSVIVTGFWSKVFVLFARCLPLAWTGLGVRRINQARGVIPRASSRN